MYTHDCQAFDSALNTMLKSNNVAQLLGSLKGPGAILKVGRSKESDLRLWHIVFPLLVSRNHAE